MSSEFFVPVRAFTVADIAQLTGSELVTSSLQHLPISGIGSLDGAQSGDLAFADKRNIGKVASVGATAVICPPGLEVHAPEGVAILTHRNPQQAFSMAGRELFPAAAVPAGVTSATGIAAGAYVDPQAMLEDGVIVEPGAIIGANVQIGSGTVVAANAVVGPNCRIGRNCFVGPNVSLRYSLLGDRVIIHAGASIGHDGFGFAAGPKGPERVPQVGRVVIQDDVEVGCNSTIDRGALSDTIIGEGTKIDNLVQIGHNTRIGRGCLIAGQCGISGSVTIGDYVMMGGGVGVGDHVKIGSGAQIGGRSGIMDEVPPGSRWFGYPAVPYREFFRQYSFLKKIGKGKKGDSDE